MSEKYNKNLFKDIKSVYFIKVIFSYLKDEIKLNIIKYNKDLQNIIDIKLFNYQFFSEKYVIIEPNGIGKVYSALSDSLIYEGGYSNGKRNGKGKVFGYKGILVFEGEYLNGKRNGKGKEYYDNNQILFEGEYKNGLRWNGKGYDNKNNIAYELNNGNGKVKEYDNGGKLIFEGEYLNGLMHGFGKTYFLDELRYEGEFLKGKKNGIGKEYNGDNKGLIFEGEFKNGLKWNGKGYDGLNNIVYELKNGKGYVKYYLWNGKLFYECEYINGLRNGKGKEYNYFGNLTFDGEYMEGRIKKGKQYYLEGGLLFEGEYLYNRKLKGKYYNKGKLEYEGEFLYDKKYNGKGYDENGNIIYELKNGNGKVKEYDFYGGQLEFEGELLNRKRNGKGKEYNKKGKLIFDGEYKNGLKWDGFGYNGDNNIVYCLNNGKGYVIEYNYYNRLVYEGKYVNGQKNGKGKEYDWDKCIKFEGEYFNGIKVFK